MRKCSDNPIRWSRSLDVVTKIEMTRIHRPSITSGILLKLRYVIFYLVGHVANLGNLMLADGGEHDIGGLVQNRVQLYRWVECELKL